MRTAVLVGYAAIFAAMLGIQLWGLRTQRTATAGDLMAMLVHRAAVRWLLVAAWLWWGWHVFVRVTL